MKSLNLRISSLVGYVKRANAFLVYIICIKETVHDRWYLYKRLVFGEPIVD